jgi:hypothetical protein
MGGCFEQGRARNLCAMVTAAACIMNGMEWQRITPQRGFTRVLLNVHNSGGRINMGPRADELRPGTEELQGGS